MSVALLASLEAGQTIEVLVGDTLISLTPDANEALRAILEAMLRSRGGVIRLRVSRDSATLSPEQVARELGVSRPFVYKLLDRGELPFESVGTHRRVHVEAVSEYLNAQQARVELAEEMAADSVRPGVLDVDLRTAARQARTSGDPAPLTAALRARRTARLADAEDPVHGGD